MAQSFSSRSGNKRAVIQLGPLVLICLSLGRATPAVVSNLVSRVAFRLRQEGCLVIDTPFLAFLLPNCHAPQVHLTGRRWKERL